MDVFIYKRTTQGFKRIMGYDGDEIDDAVLSADITPDDKVILLSSKASNIVPNGERGAMRAYLVKKSLLSRLKRMAMFFQSPL